jgi:hypothetical protein
MDYKHKYLKYKKKYFHKKTEIKQSGGETIDLLEYIGKNFIMADDYKRFKVYSVIEEDGQYKIKCRFRKDKIIEKLCGIAGYEQPFIGKDYVEKIYYSLTYKTYKDTNNEDTKYIYPLKYSIDGVDKLNTFTDNVYDNYCNNIAIFQFRNNNLYEYSISIDEFDDNTIIPFEAGCFFDESINNIVKTVDYKKMDMLVIGHNPIDDKQYFTPLKI